jgi:hypothetical protein
LSTFEGNGAHGRAFLIFRRERSFPRSAGVPVRSKESQPLPSDRIISPWRRPRTGLAPFAYEIQKAGLRSKPARESLLVTNKDPTKYN